MKTDTPFSLFANCQLVKGVERSTICDLQREKVHLIPNSLADLLTELKGLTINQIKEHFNHEFDDTITEYFEFLDNEDLIFFSKDITRFQDLNLEWNSPSAITYAILDIGEELERNIVSVCDQFDQLDCQYVEMRGYKALGLDRIDKMLGAFEGSTITSVGLILAHNSIISRTDWENLVDHHKRVTSLIVHGFPEEDEIRSRTFAVPIKFNPAAITSEQCCGMISPDYFSTNIDSFTESLKHNSCLNKKIGIDRNGNIKNCPSMKENFGNIADTTLTEAINEPGFKKHWNITKDQITKCKDCEFRYICTDCRAYLDTPEDMYSAPLKCGYDPYTCQWEDWSRHPMKQKAIVYYGMTKIIG